MKTSLLISLIASLLTGIQALLLVLPGDGLCFNEGCRIVDEMASVPPLIFNLVGLAYFQTIFWGLLFHRKCPGRILKVLNILLLAGMASEGVLFAFQLIVAEVFCSYCLIIFGFIVALNISFGFEQTVKGSLVFIAVLISFFALGFGPAKTDQYQQLDKGAYGVRSVDNSHLQLYVFFSSACPHCENVIKTMQSRQACTINFQPIDEIDSLDFPGLEVAPEYSVAVNRQFLRTLGLNDVPVLMVTGETGIQILKGERQIRQFLEDNCVAEAPALSNSTFESDYNTNNFLPQLLQDDGSCSVSEDCTTLP